MLDTAEPGNRRIWILLALLFAVAVSNQVTYTIDAIRDMAGDYPLTPVYLNNRSLAVSDVYYTPKGADVKLRDRIVAVDGRAVESAHEYYSAIRSRNLGDPIRIAFDRGGTIREYTFVLRAVFPNGAQ